MYIGSSVDIVGRYTWHRHALRNNYHPTAKLQELWSQTKEEDWEFVILQLCDRFGMREIEDLIQKDVNPVRILNTRTVTGWHHTPAQKSAIRRGRRMFTESVAGKGILRQAARKGWEKRQ